MPPNIFCDEKRDQEGAPRQHLSDSFTHLYPGDIFHEVVEVQYLHHSCLESVKPI